MLLLYAGLAAKRNGLTPAQRAAYKARHIPSRKPESSARERFTDPFPRETFVNQRVVTDGNLITAQGHAFVDCAFTIAEYPGLYDKLEAECTQLYRDIMDR